MSAVILHSFQSAEVGELAKALAAAVVKIPTIPKDKTAKIPTKSGGGFEYKYADLATVIETAMPVLASNGLVVCQVGLPENGKQYLETTIMHTSGQWKRSILEIPRADDIKVLGGYLTYLRRYQYVAIIGLATEEDTDGGPAEHARAKNNAGGAAKRTGPSKKDLDALFALSKAAKWSVDDVKKYLKDAFGVETSKDLSPAQYQQLCKHLKGGGKPAVTKTPPNDALPEDPRLEDPDVPGDAQE